MDRGVEEEEEEKEEEHENPFVIEFFLLFVPVHCIISNLFCCDTSSSLLRWMEGGWNKDKKQTWRQCQVASRSDNNIVVIHVVFVSKLYLQFIAKELRRRRRRAGEIQPFLVDDSQCTIEGIFIVL